MGSSTAYTNDWGVYFDPDNLVVSRSVYDNNPNNIQVGTILPPNCAATTGGCAGPDGATNDGSYPFVWNNDTYDGSFGITSKIFLDQITPFGQLVSSLEVPNSSQRGVSPKKDQLVTSFSSKSELALNLSTDREFLTFMGYVAPIDAIDVSNTNTPGAVDPTNPVGENAFRAVAQVDENGKFRFTETNAYSGNNGRAAILSNRDGADAFFTAGNAGNGNNPQPDGIIIGAGAQIIAPEFKPEVAQNPGDPTPVGSFSIAQLGAKPDKIGKDDNFRGLTIFDNVLYFTKGSGSNGVNTVYFVDTTGQACPTPMGGSGGVGLPQSGATLPASGLSYNPADLQTLGLPNNMCILAGFPDTPNKTSNLLPRLPFLSVSGLPTPRRSMSLMKAMAYSRTPRLKRQPDCRNGFSIRSRKPGSSPTSCRRVWSLACQTSQSLAIRAETIPQPDSPGLLKPTGCVTSPASCIETVVRPSTA